MLVWKLLPLIALMLFALVAFVLDPAAVIRLVWACVSGVFGSSVQLTAAAVLLSATAVTIWAFWPEPLPPPRNATRGSASRRPRTKAAPAAASADHDAAATVAAAAPASPVTARQTEAANTAAPAAKPKARPRAPKQTTQRAAATVTRQS